MVQDQRRLVEQAVAAIRTWLDHLAQGRVDAAMDSLKPPEGQAHARSADDVLCMLYVMARPMVQGVPTRDEIPESELDMLLGPESGFVTSPTEMPPPEPEVDVDIDEGDDDGDPVTIYHSIPIRNRWNSLMATFEAEFDSDGRLRVTLIDFGVEVDTDRDVSCRDDRSPRACQ